MESDVNGMGRALKKKEHDFARKNNYDFERIEDALGGEDEIRIKDSKLKEEDERYLISKVEHLDYPSNKSFEYDVNLKERLKPKISKE